MKTFPIGTDAIVPLQFADDAGNAVTPTAASYIVIDGDGGVLVTETPVADLSTALTVTVPSTYNAEIGPRSILLKMTTPAGVIVAETVYGVVGAQRLVYLKNSLMSYSQALFQAQNLPNVDDFTDADKDSQQLALIEAFRRLVNLNFIIPWPVPVDDFQSYLDPHHTRNLNPRMWFYMTPERFACYPDDFVTALKNAQVVEACAVLKGDQVGATQAAGLLAWSVGESKMMFKSGVGPLRNVSGMSRESMAYLKGWLSNKLSIARAS